MRKELASNARSLFLNRRLLGLLVIIMTYSSNAVIFLSLQFLLKQKLILESQHNEKCFNQMMSR